MMWPSQRVTPGKKYTAILKQDTSASTPLLCREKVNVAYNHYGYNCTSEGQGLLPRPEAEAGDLLPGFVGNHDLELEGIQAAPVLPHREQ